MKKAIILTLGFFFVSVGVSFAQTSTCIAPTSTFGLNATDTSVGGSQVSNLQKTLTTMGFPVTTTGTFNAATQTKLKEFQTAAGLASATSSASGSVDVATQTKIAAYCAAGNGGAVSSSIVSATDKATILSLHNTLRTQALSTMPALTWSMTAAAVAERYAKLQAIRSCSTTLASGQVRLIHGKIAAPTSYSFSSGTTQMGENLAAAGSSASFPSVTALVNLWSNEKVDYTYSTNTCASGKVCGHYTQMVWKNTTSVGCGYATCTDGNGMKRSFLSCNYVPAGNVVGQKPY